MKSTIDKEKRKKKQMTIYIIMGTIAYFFALFLYGHVNALMYDNKRLDFSTALNDAFTDILTNPMHVLYTADHIKYFVFGSIAIFYMGFTKAIDKSLRKHDNPDTVNGEARFMTSSDLKQYNMRRNEPFGKEANNGFGNMILSKDLMISMDGYKTKRNVNALVIGGSGSGKSRYFAGPNILQYNSNFVITDPSGGLLADYGKALEDNGYEVKVFNLSDFYSGNKYNPFHYIKQEKDVFILVNTLIKNTTPAGKNSGDPFWEKSEKLLLTALILYLWHTAPPKDQTFSKVVELINLAQINENDDTMESPLDLLFRQLEQEDPQNLAVQQYKTFKLGAGKTLKSILISVGVRLESFKLDDVKYLTSEDDLHFETFADTKQALFVILPTADTTFNFLVSMMYSQLFMTLYNYAEQNVRYGWELYTDKYNIIKVVQAKDKKDSANAKKKASELLEKIKAGTRITYDKKRKVYKIYTADKSELLGWRGTKQMADEFVSSLKRIKMQQCPKEKCPNHVRFILDEFANIGQIPDFDQKVATIRKYQISVAIILQAISQLEDIYDKKWNTLAGNCDEKVFLGSDDEKTIEWLIKMLGKKTVIVENTSWSSKSSGSTSYNHSSMELITVDQVTMMDDMDCIVRVRGEHPYYGKKYDLEDHPNYPYAKAKEGQFAVPVSKEVENRVTGPLRERQKNAPKVATPVDKELSLTGESDSEKVTEKAKEKVRKAKAERAAEKKEEFEKERMERASETAERSLLETFGIGSDDSDSEIMEKLESLIDLSEPPLESLLFASTQ